MQGSEEPMDVHTTALYAIIVVLLILGAGLMSGLTLGLLSLDVMDLEVLKASGTLRQQTAASRLIPLVAKPHWLLCTLLLCNAACMEALPLFLDRLLNPVSAILLSVTAILLFGEIIPQAVCSRFGVAIGSTLAPLVRVLMLLCSPITWPLGKVLDFVLGHESVTMKRQHLKAMVQLHGEGAGLGGKLTAQEVSVISGAMDLKYKTAVSAMTPLCKVFMVSDQALLDEGLVSAMLRSGHSRVPVFRGNNPEDFAGVILVKEVLQFWRCSSVPRINQLSLRAIPRLPADTPMFDMLRFFQTGHSHMALLTAPPGCSLEELRRTRGSVATCDEDECTSNPHNLGSSKHGNRQHKNASQQGQRKLGDLAKSLSGSLKWRLRRSKGGHNCSEQCSSLDDFMTCKSAAPGDDMCCSQCGSGDAEESCPSTILPTCTCPCNMVSNDAGPLDILAADETHQSRCTSAQGTPCCHASWRQKPGTCEGQHSNTSLATADPCCSTASTPSSTSSTQYRPRSTADESTTTTASSSSNSSGSSGSGCCCARTHDNISRHLPGSWPSTGGLGPAGGAHTYGPSRLSGTTGPVPQHGTLHVDGAAGQQHQQSGPQQQQQQPEQMAQLVVQPSQVGQQPVPAPHASAPAPSGHVSVDLGQTDMPALTVEPLQQPSAACAPPQHPCVAESLKGTAAPERCSSMTSSVLPVGRPCMACNGTLLAEHSGKGLQPQQVAHSAGQQQQQGVQVITGVAAAQQQVPVGIITLEDVIEELMQAEIVDETDAYMDNDKTQRVDLSLLMQQLPPSMLATLRAEVLHTAQILMRKATISSGPGLIHTLSLRQDSIIRHASASAAATSAGSLRRSSSNSSGRSRVSSVLRSWSSQDVQDGLECTAHTTNSTPGLLPVYLGPTRPPCTGAPGSPGGVPGATASEPMQANHIPRLAAADHHTAEDQQGAGSKMHSGSDSCSTSGGSCPPGTMLADRLRTNSTPPRGGSLGQADAALTAVAGGNRASAPGVLSRRPAGHNKPIFKAFKSTPSTAPHG